MAPPPPRERNTRLSPRGTCRERRPGARQTERNEGKATAARTGPPDEQPTEHGRRTGGSGRVPVHGFREGLGSLSTKSEVLLADEAPVWETDDLRQLVAEGQERGFLTFAQIATTLEEVDVTKEQVRELHQHFEEQGIDVVGADGRPATSEAQKVEAAAEARSKPGSDAPKKPEIDLTVEPSLDSLRLYLRSIGRVPLL